MRILMTGGGTGGHVNPALAIAETIKRNIPGAEIAFAGTPRGLENTLVPRAGYKLYHVNVRGFERKLSLKNIRAAWLALVSPLKARKIIKEFRPDIVIGTGGYVCWPVIVAASKLGVPTAVHEANAVPGLTVRKLVPYVDRIFINFVETSLPKDHPVCLTDYPKQIECLAKAHGNYRHRWELYIKGVEVANCYLEETDGEVARDYYRREYQKLLALRSDNGKTIPDVDDSFCDVVSALPKCSGVAIGLDRLLMLETGAREIDDVLLFPLSHILE